MYTSIYRNTSRMDLRNLKNKNNIYCGILKLFPDSIKEIKVHLEEIKISWIGKKKGNFYQKRDLGF